MKKSIIVSALTLWMLPNISIAEEPNSSTESHNLRIPEITTDEGYVRTNPWAVTVAAGASKGLYTLVGSTDFYRMLCRGNACDHKINFGPALNLDSRFQLEHDGSEVRNATLELPTLLGVRAISTGTNSYNENQGTFSFEAGAGPYAKLEDGKFDAGVDVGGTASGAIGYRILGANFETCAQIGGIYRISALVTGDRTSKAELGVCEVLDVSERVRLGIEGKVEVDSLMPSSADLQAAPLKADLFVTVESSKRESGKSGVGITGKAGVLKIGDETFATAGLEVRAHGAETSSSTGD